VELEFKFLADGAAFDRVRAHFALGAGNERQMSARYFDTSDGALEARGAMLRLREEDGVRVICLKLRGQMRSGAAARPEYEAPCASLEAGVGTLLSLVVPEEIGRVLRGAALRETARAAFRRTVWRVCTHGAEGELCLDQGSLYAGACEEPFCEMELEQKGGSEDAFLRWGAELERSLGLTRQEKSKYARLTALRHCAEKEK